jgi:hypothetical protein
LQPQDRAKPVSLTVKVHPKVRDLAIALGAWLNDSDLDHVVSEAILEVGKNKDFLRWHAKTPAGIADGSGEKQRAKSRKAAA